MARWACVVLLMTSVAPSALAQAERPAVLVVVDTEASDTTARAWRRRLGGSLGAQTTLGAWVRERQPAGTVEAGALTVLGRIEALLVEARAAAARLREGEALATLTQAEALAREHLEVPGMAAWYAEVQLAIAVTAAQASMTGLSNDALRRAASVDPARGVRAAEARPEVVERGRLAIRAAATAPRGRFEVRADAPGATVSLDDRSMGELPRVVEAPVGMHVLRVDAPGRHGWARVVTVFEGDRPPVTVQLSPTRLAVEARALRAAARAGDVDAVVTTLASIEERAGAAPRVWMLWPASGGGDRAVLLGCDPAGCGGVRRLREGSLPEQLAVGERDGPLGDGALGDGALRDALRWSSTADEASPPTEAPWWERWYVWAGAGALVAAAVTAAIVAALPQGPGPRQVRVEWGEGW